MSRQIYSRFTPPVVRIIPIEGAIVIYGPDHPTGKAMPIGTQKEREKAKDLWETQVEALKDLLHEFVSDAPSKLYDEVDAARKTLEKTLDQGGQ